MNPGGPGVERSDVPARTGETVGSLVGDELWERVFSRENLGAALGRVEANRGVGGVDGLGADQLRAWCVEHWADVRGRLDAGTYVPQPVRQVMIPKPDGRMRKLGVPTVLDGTAEGLVDSKTA